MHTITNPKLEESDKEVFEFNRYFAYFKENPLNRHTYIDISGRLKYLRKKVSDINPNTEFESLVLENILHILEAQQRYSNHFSDATTFASKEDITNLIDLCLGDGFFIKLEDEIPDASGPGFDAVMQVDCLIGDHPAGAKEGVRLSVKGTNLNFNKEIHGDTLFIRH